MVKLFMKKATNKVAFGMAGPINLLVHPPRHKYTKYFLKVN